MPAGVSVQFPKRSAKLLLAPVTELGEEVAPSCDANVGETNEPLVPAALLDLFPKMLYAGSPFESTAPFGLSVPLVALASPSLAVAARESAKAPPVASNQAGRKGAARPTAAAPANQGSAFCPTDVPPASGFS